MPGTVWVADDNEAVASAVAVLLESEGIPAHAVLDAPAARAELEKGRLPLAIILDLGMAGDGNGLLSCIARHPDWRFPVLLLSGAPEKLAPEHRGRVNDVLEKPVDPLELVRHVRRALGEMVQP